MRLDRLTSVLGFALLLAPSASAQTTHDVATSGVTFVPADISIQLGDTVRWTLSGFNHTVTDEPNLGPKLFDTGIQPPGTVFEFTYDEAAITQSPRIGGVYDYFCELHLSFGMIGSVTVTGIPLVTDNIVVSVGSGGSQNWSLDAGAANAGRFYLLLGSSTGTSPGLSLDGHVLPLNLDAYLLFSLSGANNPPFANTFGQLDGAGKASASISVPAGLSASLVGATFHHAFAAIDVLGSGQVEFTSNAVPLFFGS